MEVVDQLLLLEQDLGDQARVAFVSWLALRMTKLRGAIQAADLDPSPWSCKRCTMLQRTGRTAALIEPCLPSPAQTPPVGTDWLHEIKHVDFRIVASSGITSCWSGAPGARLLRIRQMAEATLREHQSRLLGVLTMKAAQRFGVTFLIEAGGSVRRMRLACVGDVVLLDYPADATRPRAVDCYLVKMLDAKRLKVGPDRLLYSLQWRRKPRQRTSTCSS
jgi:hypothetical protein